MNTKDTELVNYYRNRIVEYLADLDGSFGTHQAEIGDISFKHRMSSIACRVLGDAYSVEHRRNLFAIAMSNAIALDLVTLALGTLPNEYYLMPDGVKLAHKIAADRVKDKIKRAERAAAKQKYSVLTFDRTTQPPLPDEVTYKDPSDRPAASWAAHDSGYAIVVPTEDAEAVKNYAAVLAHLRAAGK